jgi:hypothetical protein
VQAWLPRFEFLLDDLSWVSEGQIFDWKLTPAAAATLLLLKNARGNSRRSPPCCAVGKPIRKDGPATEANLQPSRVLALCLPACRACPPAPSRKRAGRDKEEWWGSSGLTVWRGVPQGGPHTGAARDGFESTRIEWVPGSSARVVPGYQVTDRPTSSQPCSILGAR